MAFADLAPATNIFIPQFDEVDGTLVLVGPFDGKHFPLIAVNLHDGAGPDEGPHGEIGQADHAVDILTRIPMLNQADRAITPDFHQPGQEVCFVETQIGTGTQRHDDSLSIFSTHLGNQLSCR